jgi:hypothetical protein
MPVLDAELNAMFGPWDEQPAGWYESRFAGSRARILEPEPL